jgi:hypothetical protein
MKNPATLKTAAGCTRALRDNESRKDFATRLLSRTRHSIASSLGEGDSLDHTPWPRGMGRLGNYSTDVPQIAADFTSFSFGEACRAILAAASLLPAL